MKKSVVLIVMAGIASGAFGQSASLSITSSHASVDTTATTSFTLSVWGDADFGTHITGAAFTLNGSGGSGLVTDMVATGAGWGDLGFQDFGHDGDGSTGMIMGQVTFLPFISPDAASALGNGPVLLGTFEVTVARDLYFDYEWTLGGGIGSFAMEVIDVNANPDGNPPGEITQLVDVDFGSVWVGFVPAPSSIALVGLGGLMAGRRRR